MTFQGDPYRTLGVAPGASLNEIRSAYRRLAKKYHPDAAGERALPRFLAIQAAYEGLVDGEGRLRPAGSWGGGGGPGRAQGGGPEPSRTDTTRPRASRDAWRARWAGGGAGARGARSGPAAGASTRADGTTGDAAGADGSTGPAGTHGTSGGHRGASAAGPRPGPRPGMGERQHHRRGPRKATQGSTTYDEALGTPLDPEWDGGAWYGPSSGTYWTINPREYADPRKHGPEYLARARRTITGEHDEPSSPDARSATARGTDAEDDDGRWHWSGAAATATDGGAAEWGTRAWTYDDGGAARPAWTPGAEGRARRAGLDPADATENDVPALPDLESIARRASPASLLELANRPGRGWRLLIACIGWPPIGFALGTLASTATGCARFAASCPEPLPVILLLVQPLVVAGLYAAPVLAASAAFAAMVALAVALPAAAILSVGSLPDPGVEATVLELVALAAYLVAFTAAALRLWGRPSPPDPAP